MSQTRAQLLKGFSNTSASDDVITVDSSGQVGVGKTSPAGLLHIAKDGGNAKLLIQRSNTAANTNDYGSILWQSSAGNNNAAIGVARHSAENDGYMFFSTASGGSLQEELRIQSAGGISFNGDTGQANALDDYEEGTWTPTINFDLAFTGGTYTVNEGFYTKIGRLVNVSCEIALSSKGSSTGQVNIAGLPFTPNSDDESRASGVVGYHQDVTGIDMPIQILVEPNSTQFPLRDSGSTSSTGISDSNLGNGFRFYFTITYMT